MQLRLNSTELYILHTDRNMYRLMIERHTAAVILYIHPMHGMWACTLYVGVRAF